MVRFPPIAVVRNVRFGRSFGAKCQALSTSRASSDWTVDQGLGHQVGM